MAKIKLTADNNITMEAEGSDRFVSTERKAFYEMFNNKTAVKNLVSLQEACKTEKPLTAPTVHPDGVKEETIVIYDDAGIPSIMRKFSRVSNAELFEGGSDEPHPAFIIDGEVYDEIYISVYPNCEINGKPYSLPYMKPWTNIDLDEMAKACFNKGDGWHLMTAAEWGLVANISKRDDTLPHGNTDNGHYHADASEAGQKYDSSGRTLTGSGPSTWTHNHQPDGIHDLCGNVWERVSGLRIKDGVLQIIRNNDAALNENGTHIDTSADSANWENLIDPATGKPICISVGDDLKFTTDEPESGWNGARWGEWYSDIGYTEAMKALALYPGEENAYMYADSSEGEYTPYRGGDWVNGSAAGVFHTSLYRSRTIASTDIGFRSAYYKRKTDN